MIDLCRAWEHFLSPNISLLYEHRPSETQNVSIQLHIMALKRGTSLEEAESSG